jgi:alpha-beta hydrolase superfamily lysophospholipase
VYGLDVPCYGPNESRLGHIASRHALLKVIQTAITLVNQVSQRPVLLVGLSLGGLLCTHALAQQWQHPLPVKGLVLISPAFKGASASFTPKTYAQVVYHGLVTKSRQPIYIPYDITSITGDATQQARLAKGTDCVQALTAGSFLELLKLTLSRSGFRQLTYPLLLFRAETDTICDTTAMDAIWRNWPNPKKQMTIFANVRHDLVLEPVITSMAHQIGMWQTTL